MIRPSCGRRVLAAGLLWLVGGGCRHEASHAGPKHARAASSSDVSWTPGTADRLELQTQTSEKSEAPRTLYIEGGKIKAVGAPPPAWAGSPEPSRLMIAGAVARPVIGVYGYELYTEGDPTPGAPATLAVVDASAPVERAPFRLVRLILVDGAAVFGAADIAAAVTALKRPDLTCAITSHCNADWSVCPPRDAEVVGADRTLVEEIYERSRDFPCTLSSCSCEWPAQRALRLDTLPRGTWKDRWSFVLLQTAVSAAALAAISYDAALVANDLQARNNARTVFWWSLAAAIPSVTWWLVEEPTFDADKKNGEVHDIDLCLASCPPPTTTEGM